MSTEEQPEEENEDLRYFVRIGRTDLDGTKSVVNALSEMNGIGRRSAHIITQKAGVDKSRTFGLLEDDEIDTIVELVEGYADEVPEWLVNHRKKYYTGENVHETGNDLQMATRQDINRMKMIRSYRGIRHERGQKVRGQRTRSTGRTEGTIGVNVEEIKEEAAAAAAEEDEGE